jgi:polygalacturonase
MCPPNTNWLAHSFFFIFWLLLLGPFGCATSHRAVLNVRDFGALGDGKTKDTAAVQKALDACAAAGGGEVVMPAGNYLLGSIELKSRTTLRLENGAHLAGSPDLEDYPVVKVRWEGRWIDGHRALISARDASGIGVVGPGKISGNPALGGRQMPRRPALIEPVNCKYIRLDCFATDHRSMWSLHPTGCENVTAAHLTIRGTGGNGDGIDVDSCKHVRIESCDIDIRLGFNMRAALFKTVLAISRPLHDFHASWMGS